MMKHSLYDKYRIDFKEEYETDEDSYFLIFYEDKMYLKNNELPKFKKDKLDNNSDIDFNLYIGEYDNVPCFIVNLLNCKNEEEFYNLQDIFKINDKYFLIAGRGIQVRNWYKDHQYCGVCGSHNIVDNREMMLKCPKCGHLNYSRIAPAIIVSIKKDDKLLMAYHSYYKTKEYTLTAGFVEAGETLEEAVKREVKEEVGINIKNIKYFGSQSWPFPNSLMIGFTAEYESGNIEVDNFEILDAKWFSKNEIKRRSNISISSWLIDNFLDN